MKQRSTLFLKVVVVLLGIIVLGLCIFLLPQGVLSDKTGYYRPLLIGLYIPTIPFFIALYQAFKLLNLIDRKKAFSKESAKALGHIKYCGIIISILFAVGMPYIFYVGDRDDAPGVVAIGFVIIFASIVIATFAAVLQKLLQEVIEIKAENDLTV